MVEIVARSGLLPHIPDNLTIPQFILDTHHPVRPERKTGTPWFVEDATGRGLGYEQLRMRTYGLANALAKRYRIGENDVVCLFSPNHVDYATVIWATHRLGAIITPANPGYTPGELAYQLETTKTKLLFIFPAFYDTALAAAKQTGMSPDQIVLIDESGQGRERACLEELVKYGLKDETSFEERRLAPGEGKTKLAFLSFSSGTTGKPKAVKIPHHSVIANVIQMAIHNGVNDPHYTRFMPGDVAIAVLPFFHIYGLVINMHFLLFSGLSLVVIQRFNFEEYLKSIVRYKITHLFVVPPQVVLLCKHPAVKKYDLSHVKCLMSGAAPLSPELTNQAIKLLPKCSLGQGYGLTETCTSITMFGRDQSRGTVGSAGQLLPGIVAKVVKPDGSLAKTGEQGELVVTGPSMALGYWNNEAATKETFVDGWVRTGDEVIIDENQDVFVVDRIKEIIKVRGFQVAPAELEGHLLDHPDVSDACVVSLLEEFSGEIPLAYVVLSEGAAARTKRDANELEKIRASIIKHVERAKVQYKWLKGGVEFVDAIPKNPSGKMLRRVLRDKARAEKAQAKAKL